MSNHKKVAIVYDWIDSWGGVERVILELHKLFTEADFYTSYYDTHKAHWANSLKITPSFLQKVPHIIRSNRVLSLPFFPYVFESFDFSSYDLVISISSLFAKSVITQPQTTHICYLLTPPRYLWGMTEQYLTSPVSRMIAMPLLRSLRTFDYVSAQRPDKIISISKAVADRCKKYYGRDSEVIYPPFDQKYWESIKIKEKSEKRKVLNSNYYLVVSRLEPYKNIDLVIDVFNNRSDTLIIVGKGTQLDRLKQKAQRNIIFKQDISDTELAHLYEGARALIMPQEEDFGYISLEAQYFNCPVIAYGVGGAVETVKEGETGIFFDTQTKESLEEALARSRPVAYNGKQTFDSKAFDTFFRSL